MIIDWGGGGEGVGGGGGERVRRESLARTSRLIFSLYTGSAPPVMLLLQAFTIR